MSLVLAGGGGYDKDAVDLLWKYLLATHAHDSIHGSGDPKIKTDNLNRIAQAQCLAESLTRGRRIISAGRSLLPARKTISISW